MGQAGALFKKRRALLLPDDFCHEIVDQGLDLAGAEDGRQLSLAITYTYNVRQYETAVSGIGGVLNHVMKVADGTPTGGSVWIFALMPE